MYRRYLVKRYNLIYYWQNFLANQDDVSLKPNAYVIKFCIVNKYSYDYYCNWYSFAKVEKLISFLKCVVIPSTYITKAFGKDENTIFLDALDKYECMEYLERASVFDKRELLRRVNREYDFLSRVEKCNLGIEGVKKYLELINKYNDKNSKIFLELEFYKNVNMIGKGLIDEYEKENMLDDLEENMSLNKNEILSMFENIDKNMFMLKRLNTYLNNTLTF